MGLDMYLERSKKVNGLSINEIGILRDYIDWKESGNECSFMAWCGRHEAEVKTDYIDKIKNENIDFQEVGYWRKANQIHNWFVQNVQNGIDDCGRYEVSKEDLIKLRNLCEKVLNAAIFEDDYVIAYTTYEDIEVVKEREKGHDVQIVEYENGWVQVKAPGKVIVNENEIAELLPTSSGFFFGSYEYDEYYFNDLRETIDVINNVLDETDFETYIITYCSSW